MKKLRLLSRNARFILLFTCNVCYSQQPVLREGFDNGTVAGVKGNAKVFDGYFGSHEIEPGTVPTAENFTIEAWIAVQEYATNVAAIADKESEFKSGYLFGINQYGKLSASVAVNGNWLTLVSEEAIPLLKWTHVAVTFQNGKKISLYINGKKRGSMDLPGAILFCDTCKLSIGKTQTKTTATNTERATSMNIKTYNRFDGLIDEFKVHNYVLNDEIIANDFATIKPTQPQPLQYRQMPSGPAGRVRFGAINTKLQYAPGWDALWRGSDAPDIVVRFDNSPVKFVFWRGTGYIPAIVSENNRWATDQSLEHYGTGECYEAMGDKQTRYSHVRIIENTAARVVVHWRYALAGIKHQLLPEDEFGWGDWVDEYWTIYPDGVAARKQVLWSKRYETDKGAMQWQETIFFCQPGTRPQDNVEMEALTFMDLDGHKKSYSWESGPPKVKLFAEPQYQPIEVINFKSAYKPYNIFNERRICRPYSLKKIEAYTTFPNWNHWPVQQVASDGRNAVAPDKPSHASLTDGNGNTQIAEKRDDGSYWAGMLKGMTDKPIDSLLLLARSWNFAAPISNLSSGTAASYDKYQRAYVLRTNQSSAKQISFTINASALSPVSNLPLVIENWDAGSVAVTLNNKVLKEGKDFSVGTMPGLKQNNVILFIKIISKSTLAIRLQNKLN